MNAPPHLLPEQGGVELLSVVHDLDPGGVPGHRALQLQLEDLGVGGGPVAGPLDNHALLEQIELPAGYKGDNCELSSE